MEMTEDPSTRIERLYQQLSELHARASVQERPFTSDTPVIGRLLVRLREAWNSISTRWYVRPMLHQQNLFNQQVIQAYQELLEAHVELNRELQEKNRQLEALLEQVEAWLINSERDVTLLARKLAEGEHRIRQWERQSLEARERLGRQLSEGESGSRQPPEAAQEKGQAE
jgi:septal ring factor EnvC (AmiA/AmiB activator)